MTVRDEPVVRPLGDAAPPDRIGRLIWQTLCDAGPMRLSDVIGRVADQLVMDDQRTGAWLVDVGLIGSTLYQPDVERALRAQVGRSVALERERG